MKWTYIALASLAVASCSSSPEEMLAKAKKAYAAHDYAAARLHLAAAADEAPDNREIMLLRARTALALGDGEGAGVMLERLAGGKAPTNTVAELLAEAALLRNAPEQAVQFVANDKSAEAFRLRALAFLQQQNLDGARGQFRQAVATGDNARAFADYARFELMAGDQKAAQELSNRALKIAPGGLDALLVGGQMAAVQGNLALALERYNKANQNYPGNVSARIGQAAVLGDLGRIGEMEKILAGLSSAGVKNSELTYLWVRAAVARKEWSKVRDLVQAVEKDLPQYDPTRLLYGQALLQLKQPELAIAQIAPIARVQPGNRMALQLLAEAQLAAGDAQAALTTFRPVGDSAEARPEELQLMEKIATAAGDPSAQKYRRPSLQPAIKQLGADLAEGDMAMRQGNWAKAVVAYDRILGATDGRNVMVLNNMAYAQLMLGNTSKAVDFAGRAVKLAPSNPSVLDTMGWAMFQAGKNPEEALRILRKASQLAPQNATIKTHLAEAERKSG